MNKSRVVGKTLQQENLEQRLSQIEDMISQTIFEKEKRFAQLSQRVLESKMRQYNKSLTRAELSQLNMPRHELLSAHGGSKNHLNSSTRLMMGTSDRSKGDTTP